MAQEKNRKNNMDANRGIQNTEARFADAADKRLLINKLQQDTSKKHFEESRISELQNNPPTLEQTQRVKYASLGPKQAHALAPSASLVKNGLGFSRFFGFGFLISTGLLQMSLALFSILGFFTGAAQSQFCSSTGGKLVCGATSAFGSVIDFISRLNISGIFNLEWIGWGFWIPIILITFVVFLSSLIYFTIQKTPIFESSAAFIVTGLSLGMNLIPILNIIPWIQIWAGFWLMYSATTPIRGLSNTHKKP